MILFTLLTALPARAQDWPSIDEPLRSRGRARGEAGVVIGIEDYAFVPDVPYARRDAAAFYSFLTYTRGVPAERLSLMDQGASREMILQSVDRAARQAGQGGTVWVYFAGHGAASPEDGSRLLLGDDARRDAAAFIARGVSIAELKALIAQHGGKAILVVDACYAGVGRAGQELLPGKRILVPDYGSAPTSAHVEWSAASPSQLSGPLEPVEHGAFTYFLIGALRGWADGELSGERDGVVTAAEAQQYVSRALPVVGVQQQRPVLVAAAPDSVSLSAGASEVGPVLETLHLSALRARVQGSTALGGVGEILSAHDHAMVPLRPGSFMMGTDDPADYDDAKPRHRVKLTERVLIGAVEVSQGLWETVMGDNPTRDRTYEWTSGGQQKRIPCQDFGVGAELPVTCIDWVDAARFCNRLSALENLPLAYEIDGDDVFWNHGTAGYRMPTEAEWEYAARAGSALNYGSTDRPAEVCRTDNIADQTYGSGDTFPCTDGAVDVAPVGSRAPNAWGLHDMLGNVSEWVWDRRGAYGSRGLVDPLGPVTGRHGLFRGGSFLSGPADARVTYRGWLGTELDFSVYVGLRLARSLID